MIEGTNSRLEREIPTGRNNDSFDGFLIFEAPDPSDRSLSLYYDGYETFTRVRLS